MFFFCLLPVNEKDIKNKQTNKTKPKKKSGFVNIYLLVSCVSGKRSTSGEVTRSEGYVESVGLRCVLCLYEADCDPASQEKDAFSRPFAALWSAHMWK